MATSDSSRDELNNFFDSLAAHDEAKHVLHEARYPRRQSMRQLLPTSIMPAKPKKSEVKHLQHEVTWLRKRVVSTHSTSPPGCATATAVSSWCSRLRSSSSWRCEALPQSLSKLLRHQRIEVFARRDFGCSDVSHDAWRAPW